MENNENFVAEVTENVETTTTEEMVGEQTQDSVPAPKSYTQEELNEIVAKRLARNTAKVKKEFERKYGGLEEVLMAGTGKKSVEELTDTFKQFYAAKGIKLPEKQKYSDQDIEVLAKAEAEDIIRLGYDDVVEEVERLANVGAANMTKREKAVFKALAEYRQSADRERELSEIGVAADVINGKDFKDFASKFNANTPVRDIYNIYKQTLPKKEIKPMGSMKNSTSKESAVKEFYTVEEARKFTKKDFDRNPELFAAVERSMLQWGKNK